MRAAGVLRLVAGVGIPAVLVVGLIGLAHLPAGRPLLRLLTGATCPVGFGTTLTPEQHDAARATALGGVQGDERALARPALSFTLDSTSRVEIHSWATANGVTCADLSVTTRCEHATAASLGALHDVDSVLFQFDARDRLVSVATAIQSMPPQDAVAAIAAGSERLTLSAGPPILEQGQMDGEWLARGAMNQLAREYRFTDYRAQLSATNVGNGRISVREVYQSIPTTPAAVDPAG